MTSRQNRCHDQEFRNASALIGMYKTPPKGSDRDVVDREIQLDKNKLTPPKGSDRFWITIIVKLQGREFAVRMVWWLKVKTLIDFVNEQATETQDLWFHDRKLTRGYSFRPTSIYAEGIRDDSIIVCLPSGTAGPPPEPGDDWSREISAEEARNAQVIPYEHWPVTMTRMGRDNEPPF